MPSDLISKSVEKSAPNAAYIYKLCERDKKGINYFSEFIPQKYYADNHTNA